MQLKIKSVVKCVGDHPKTTSAFFLDFWYTPPLCRQFLSTIRRQFWPSFYPSPPPPNCRRRLWTAPYAYFVICVVLVLELVLKCLCNPRMAPCDLTRKIVRTARGEPSALRSIRTIFFVKSQGPILRLGIRYSTIHSKFIGYWSNYLRKRKFTSNPPSK